MSLVVTLRIFASSDRTKKKKKMEMKNKKISVVIFLSVICESFCSSPTSVIVRQKRWENGDMGTGDMSNMFRGTAGVDYPDLKSVPNTSFRCEDQEYEGGLYADVEARCQVYHVCHDGRKDSFLCGRGTIFNQQILACDYWYSAECDSAPSYYYLNSQIGNTDYRNNLQDYSQQNDNNRHYSGNNDSTGRNQQVPTIGGHAHQHNGQNQQACQCFKSSNKTPWSFPAGKK